MTTDRDKQQQRHRATRTGKLIGMDMTSKQAKRMQQNGRRATPEADRGNVVATTNERDMDGLNEDASSASVDRRLDELMQDRRDKDD